MKTPQSISLRTAPSRSASAASARLSFGALSGNKTLGKFIRFAFVGGSGVLVDMGVLFLLSDARTFGWALSFSKTLAAEAAVVNNFVWNDVWTFRDVSSQQTGAFPRIRRFIIFNLICIAGIGLNVGLLQTQVSFFHLNVYLANFIAIFVVSVWNFWMNLKFGWKQPH